MQVHRQSRCTCVCRDETAGGKPRHSDGRILGAMFESSPVGAGNETVVHLVDALFELDYPVLSGLI